MSRNSMNGYVRDVEEHLEKIWLKSVNDGIDPLSKIMYFQFEQLNRIILCHIDVIASRDCGFYKCTDKIYAIKRCLYFRNRYGEKAKAWLSATTILRPGRVR